MGLEPATFQFVDRRAMHQTIRPRAIGRLNMITLNYLEEVEVCKLYIQFIGIVAKRQVGMYSIRDSDGIVVLKMFIVTYLGTLN